jgi:hypothetical protein
MKSSWSGKWFLMGISLLMVLVLVGAGLYVGLNRYLASEEFRRLMSEVIRGQFKVEGEFEPFRWQGFTVFSNGYRGTGTPESPFASIQAEQIFAHLSWRAFFEGRWQLDEIRLGSLQVSVQEPQAPTDQSVKGAAPLWPASGAMSFFPREFRLVRVQIEHAELRLPPAWGGGFATGMRVEAQPQGQVWEITGEGGAAQFRPLPELSVHHFRLRLRPERLYLTEAELRTAAGGVLTAAGEFGLNESQDITVRGKVQRVPLTEVLTPDWRTKFTGELAADYQFTKKNAETPWSLSGEAKVEGGRLEALPILEQWALLTQTRDFRSLKLKEARAAFLVTPESVQWSALALESEGILRCEGRGEASAQSLAAELHVGTTAAQLRFLPGAQTEVFRELRDGYYWTPVQLGGSPSQPTENLSPRLLAAAAQVLPQKIEESIKSATDLLRGLLP